MLVASICFATSSPLARVAAPAHPLLIAAGRTAVASCLLLAASPRVTARAVGRASRRQILGVLGAGALLAAHFACFLWGLSLTSLPSAVTLVSLEPVAVVLTAWAAFGSRPRPGEAAGVLLATLGAVVVARGAGSGSHHLLGDGLVLLAVGLYGLYLGAARALSQALPPGAYAALVYGSATVVLGLACLGAGASLSLPRGSYLAILALGIIPTLGGHTLVQWAARHVPASVVALVSPGETLGSLVLAAALLGEVPSATEGVGALLALSGVAVTLASPR